MVETMQQYNRKYIRKKKDILISLTNTNFYNVTQAFQIISQYQQESCSIGMSLYIPVC